MESYGPTGAAAGRCDFPLAAVQMQENARRTRCGVRGRIRNEHDGRRLAPAVANAWLAQREELALGGQAQCSSGSELR
jgi:hypothetical protein